MDGSVRVQDMDGWMWTHGRRSGGQKARRYPFIETAVHFWGPWLQDIINGEDLGLHIFSESWSLILPAMLDVS